VFPNPDARISDCDKEEEVAEVGLVRERGRRDDDDDDGAPPPTLPPPPPPPPPILPKGL
jgi:hypothetical protein